MWDGTAHYALQLHLARATLLGRPCRLAGLVWAGSIINSMPVLLLGGASGVYSADIKPSTALNAPYVLVPIAYLISILTPKSPGAVSQDAGGRTVGPVGPSTYAWAGAHAAAIGIHSWRAIVVLGSRAPLALWWVSHVDPVLGDVTRPSFGFVRVQILVFFFYYIPFHSWAVYSLLVPSSTKTAAGRQRLATWATFFAGAYAQAQATSGGAACLKWVGFEPLAWQLVPTAGLALSFALVLMPALFALRCCRAAA